MALGKSFIREQIRKTKISIKKTKYTPYKKELRKSLKFWNKELKKKH